MLNACTQSHRSGAIGFKGGKRGTDKGSNRTGRGVKNEANSLDCEAFSASQARHRRSAVRSVWFLLW